MAPKFLIDMWSWLKLFCVEFIATFLWPRQEPSQEGNKEALNGYPAKINQDLAGTTGAAQASQSSPKSVAEDDEGRSMNEPLRVVKETKRETWADEFKKV